MSTVKTEFGVRGIVGGALRAYLLQLGTAIEAEFCIFRIFSSAICTIHQILFLTSEAKGFLNVFFSII